MNEYFLKLDNQIRKNYIEVIKGFFKWIILGFLMGIILGAVGTSFYYCIESATFFRENHSWIILFLPLAGAAIIYFYNAMGYPKDKGTNLVLLAVRDNEKMGLKHTVSIYVASVITHLFGGSSGREGAALQIGGSIGSQLGRILRLDEDDKRILTMSGMSAAFSALFGTPVAAAFFAMEVISIGIFHYSAIVACVISSLIANEFSNKFNVGTLKMSVVFPEHTAGVYIKIIVLAVLCALLSNVFCTVMKYTSKAYQKIKNQTLRAVIGGAIVASLTFIIGTFDYNGAGGGIITASFTEPAKPEAFALKLLFTALTLCAGFKGGEIVPVFFVGSTFGSVIADLSGLNCSLGASIGMISLFCGVTNCPIASLLLSLELFGSEGIAFYALSCSISYMLSGYQGLYSEQKILYSKLKTKYINKTIGDKN